MNFGNIGFPMDDDDKKRKPLTPARKLQIAKGQDMICGRCGRDMKKYGYDIHHKDGDPSNNDITNLVAWCTPCHREYTAKKNKGTKKKKTNEFDLDFGDIEI